METVTCAACGARLETAGVANHMKLSHAASDSFVCESHKIGFYTPHGFMEHWKASHLPTEVTDANLTRAKAKVGEQQARLYSDAVAAALAAHGTSEKLDGMIRTETAKIASLMDRVSTGALLGSDWRDMRFLVPNPKPAVDLTLERKKAAAEEALRLAKRAFDNGMSVGWIASAFELPQHVVREVVNKGSAGGIGFQRLGTDQDRVQQAEAENSLQEQRRRAVRAEDDLKVLGRTLADERATVARLHACLAQVAAACKPNHKAIPRKDRFLAYTNALDLRKHFERKNHALQETQNLVVDLQNQLADYLDAEDDTTEEEVTGAVRTGPDFVWHAAAGPIKVRDMSTGHVVNTIALLRRNAEQAADQLRRNGGSFANTWEKLVDQPAFSELCAELSRRRVTFEECPTCKAKPGSPELCKTCQVVRSAHDTAGVQCLKDAAKAVRETPRLYGAWAGPPQLPGGMVFVPPTVTVQLGAKPTVEPDSETVRVDFARELKDVRWRKRVAYACTAAAVVTAAALTASMAAGGLQQLVDLWRSTHLGH